jgi:hydrogenase/urease accessory protein HupE
VRVLLSCALVLAFASSAAAHRLAPSYLELREQSPGVFALLWRTPDVVARGARLEPQLPCTLEAAMQSTLEPGALALRSTAACPNGLVGEELRVDGLADSGTDAIVHVVFADGRELRAILTAARPSFRVPEREDAADVAVSYGRFGVEHLLSGLDHVLFVLGLLALLRSGRPLLLAITAFTLGHSVTLAAASLGWVRVPAAAVEIAIAISLVALASALARPDRGASSSLVRWPALLPFAFGLLHGLGFAGALAAAGLPGHALPLALFSFNVGIELGQLALVALAWPLLAGLRRLPLPRAGFLCELPATALGGIGVYLCLDRAAAWLLVLPS